MLPKQTLYTGKKESSPARRYRSNIQPSQGGNFGPGQTITINIPTSPNVALIASESTLNFGVTFTNSSTGTAVANARWESCGAHALISRIRLFSGSNLLEDCDSYNVLAKVLMDHQVSEDWVKGKGSMMIGTRQDSAVTVDAVVQSVNTGALINTTGAIGLSSTSTIQYYNLNLISLIGSLSAQKYFPLWACTGSPLRAEITLVSNPGQAMSATGILPSTFTVSNVEYVGEFIELPDSAIDTIMSASSPLQYVVPAFRNYQWTTSLSDSIQVAMPIPAKVSSLKSLFVTSRNSANANGVVNQYPIASVKNGLASYQFRIGSQIVPSKPPSTDPEFAVEATKCFASLSDLNHQPSITNSAFTQNAPTQNGAGGLADSGSFLIGLDCEVYAGADKTEIFQGLNTNASDIYLTATYGTVAQAAVYRYDAFANFDQVLVFENGNCYTRF